MQRSQRYVGLILVLLLLGFVCAVLMTAVAIYLINTPLNLSPAEEEGLKLETALGEVTLAAIDPPLAVVALGGGTRHDLVIEAVRKSRPETALATLLFATTMDDRSKAGNFILVGEGYLSVDQPHKATYSYHLAALIATVSPNLADNVRADLLLQASNGFVKTSAFELALFYLDQTSLIAEHSAYLQAAQRQALFERLQKGYIMAYEAGRNTNVDLSRAEEAARRSLALSANPPNVTGTRERVSILPPVNGVIFSEDVQRAEAERWVEAQKLAVALVNQGDALQDELTEPLRQALLAEDALKTEFFASSRSAPQISAQADVIIGHIDWLSLKYQVAQQAFGLSLVPEWEQDVPAIERSLDENYVQLFNIYNELAITLPDLTQFDQATQELLLTEILAGELHHYPNAPREELSQRLQPVSERLFAQDPSQRLFLSFVDRLYIFQVR